ncbi:MAG: carbohydrate binding family 9 domain-containing protein [Colwellia sp.]
MNRLICYSFILVVLAFLSAQQPVLAQEKTATQVSIQQPSTAEQKPNKTLAIPYSTLKATIDGELDDAIWNNALIVSLNIVNSPWNNLASPVKTEAKIVENGNFLYVSFIAYDPNPENIQGFLGDRDTRWYDDIVGIKLDTHNNRRLNYEFFVNPFGVQNDAIFNEITGLANGLWDGIWQSYGKITKQGYQVEIAIPYNILNFEENNQEKKWAIELVRIYPREKTLRISHVPLNRDDPCWLCQYPEATGFKHATIGNNIRLTPAITASNDQTRDIYNSQDNWHADNTIEAGLDLRWGIDANSSLNATLNPDFSTVEADAGQLSVNTNFSLFYDEKRAFFLDNSDYFSSNYDLVYTRNIADPDYGLKFTGREKQHSYGVFVTNDTETNFVIPGNLSSDIASLNQESHATALRYRYDHNDDLSIGAISTLRTSNNYHNYLVGLDGKYRFNESNTFKLQLLSSDTEYPDDLFQDFCLTNDCNTRENIDCSFGNCSFTEQTNRAITTDGQTSFNDQAVKIDFDHNSEYWQVKLNHQNIGGNFRADLGFMPKADIKQNTVSVDRLFYGEQDSLWQQAYLSGQWQIIHNENNELIERSLSSSFNVDGPKQSIFEVNLTHAEKVGLRHNDSILTLDNNTTRFTEDQIIIYSQVKPTARTDFSLELTLGDKIDYSNNRLGDIHQVAANVTWNITNHLEFNFYQTYSKLDAENNSGSKANVYIAKISELRLSYQFDVHSYLKLNIVYLDVERNQNNNDYIDVFAQEKSLSTQLIYAYKLNPQTVFFLGYSDNSYQDDDLNDLTREEKTFFTKVSYSWVP